MCPYKKMNGSELESKKFESLPFSFMVNGSNVFHFSDKLLWRMLFC